MRNTKIGGWIWYNCFWNIWINNSVFVVGILSPRAFNFDSKKRCSVWEIRTGFILFFQQFGTRNACTASLLFLPQTQHFPILYYTGNFVSYQVVWAYLQNQRLNLIQWEQNWATDVQNIAKRFYFHSHITLVVSVCIVISVNTIIGIVIIIFYYFSWGTMQKIIW